MERSRRRLSAVARLQRPRRMTTIIGFLGAGAIAQALASQLVRLEDTRVILTSRRGPTSLQTVTDRLGPAARPGDAVDLEDADAIVLSVPWSQVPAALDRLDDWKGRLLIDTTNPIEAPTSRMASLGGETASSRVVAHLANGAKVVKAPPGTRRARRTTTRRQRTTRPLPRQRPRGRLHLGRAPDHPSRVRTHQPRRPHRRGTAPAVPRRLAADPQPRPDLTRRPPCVSTSPRPPH
ncbi:NADPH-dependent F420 reductase [Nocardioides thalensis]|uniref:NADPH-dependent F420 reductase n=1 Tax=Nocardioides thalensis TaxID=1914755 RepID=UPI003CCD49AD